MKKSVKKVDNWKSVPGFEGLYEISNCGLIRNYITKYILKPQLNRGYECLSLCKNGIKIYCRVHRLVMFAYGGFSKKEINHIDGNKRNNHISNLEYCTRSENMKHAFDLGLHNLSGINHNNSKFTEEDLSKIRCLIERGVANKKIAKYYNVDPSTISHIKRGATYQKK